MMINYSKLILRFGNETKWTINHWKLFSSQILSKLRTKGTILVSHLNIYIYFNDTQLWFSLLLTTNNAQWHLAWYFILTLRRWVSEKVRATVSQYPFRISRDWITATYWQYFTPHVTIHPLEMTGCCQWIEFHRFKSLFFSTDKIQSIFPSI